MRRSSGCTASHEHYAVCEHLCHALHQASIGPVPIGPEAVGLGPTPILIRACTATNVYRSVAAGTHGVSGAELCKLLVPAMLAAHDNLAHQKLDSVARRMAAAPEATIN